MEKNKMSDKIATALDYAIRDHEVGSDTWKYGYKINDKVYGNYMSNEYWESYKKDMPEEYRRQFENGSGGELKEKKGRWGIYPPKMASFGSSSRMIYEFSKDIPGFCFEAQLDTRVGGIANLDGLLHRGNKYIYVEAKRREIYGASHERQKIKSVYFPVYDKLISDQFRYESEDIEVTNKQEETKRVTFYINDKPVKYFDLKQLICHFLGITYDIAKHSVKDPKVTFLYLLYNPNVVENEIDEKYRKKVIDRYEKVASFIREKEGVFKSIFDAVLQYQTETYKIEKPNIAFEFKLVEQNDYIVELNKNDFLL